MKNSTLHCYTLFKNMKKIKNSKLKFNTHKNILIYYWITPYKKGTLFEDSEKREFSEFKNVSSRPLEQITI